MNNSDGTAIDLLLTLHADGALYLHHTRFLITSSQRPAYTTTAMHSREYTPPPSRVHPHIAMTPPSCYTHTQTRLHQGWTTLRRQGNSLHRHLIALRVNGVLHLIGFVVVIIGVLRPRLSVQGHRLHFVYLQISLDLAAAIERSGFKAGPMPTT